jgi:futalosine hydrolase
MADLISKANRSLLVAAAPREAQAVLNAFGIESESIERAAVIELDNRFDLIMSGVGKSGAAAATVKACTENQYASVISIGIAGALPSDQSLSIGSSVIASRSSFSDEGVGSSDGFIPMSTLGFPAFTNGQDWIDHDQALVDHLHQITEHIGTIATVSWCSGDDGCAQGVVKRTGACAEAMEGASVALAAQMIDPSIRTSELRVISNTTGNRDKQVWDLDGALAKLTELMEVLGRLR